MSPERRGFPTTRLSVLSRARSPEGDIRRAAYEALVNGYWKPVYMYLRARWNLSPEDAGDATQEFFLKAFASESPPKHSHRDKLPQLDYRAGDGLSNGPSGRNQIRF